MELKPNDIITFKKLSEKEFKIIYGNVFSYNFYLTRRLKFLSKQRFFRILYKTNWGSYVCRSFSGEQCDMFAEEIIKMNTLSKKIKILKEFMK